MESKLNTTIPTRERPILATLARASLERGAGASAPGVFGDTLLTAGSGGSSTSATSRAGLGAVAGDCAATGIKLSRAPGSAGKMGFGILALRLEHGFPAASK